VLDRFGVTADALLGEGGQSSVYALDDRRVLKIHRATEPEHIATLGAFYAGLARDRVPFQLPRLLDWGVHAGRTFSIEERIDGVPLYTALRSLTGEERRRALSSYVDAALLIRELRPPDRTFGELLADPAVVRDSWADFLWARAEQSYAESWDDLSEDVSDLRAIIERFGRDLELVRDVSEAHLVHGDYFPGNVMVDGEQAVRAVIDFSSMTIAGDWRLDAAAALHYLEVVRGYREDDSRFVRELLTRRAPECSTVFDLYRTYCALYFSTTRRQSPRLYEWCVRSLNRGRD
jgi:putative membrane protein